MIKRLACVVVLQYAVPMTVAQLPPVPGRTDTVAKAGPSLFVAQRVRDLGTVLEGDKSIMQWRLENRGKADLIIEQARSSCGCAVVKLTDEQKTIPPGKSLDLKVEFNSQGRRGAQSKFVTISSNDPVEPKLKLEFKANVEFLYDMKPSGLVNLRAVQRGKPADRVIEIRPGPNRQAVKILELQVSDDSPLRFHHEPFVAGGGTGQRVHMTVREHVSLGTLTAKANLKLSIDGIERQRTLSFRGEVVGDLTWHPKTVNVTRQVSQPGKRLAPVTIRSTDKMRFDILEAGAGSLFDVTFEPAEGGPKGIQYSVFLTLRDDAPPGPFGTLLKVRTSVLDQPLVRVPVFGVVARPIEVEPPMIILHQDGTPVGTHRRVKLQVRPQLKLDVSDIVCSNDAVTAALDRKASSPYQHLSYLDVRLKSRLPVGTHQAVLAVSTNIKGAERLEVPVTIEVPAGSE